MLRDIAPSYADAVYIAKLIKHPERPSREYRSDGVASHWPPPGFALEAPCASDPASGTVA